MKLFANVAINKHFLINTDTNGETRLFYKEYSIGSLDFDKKEVTLLQKQLKQEVLDLFKYTGIKTWMLNLTATE